VLIPQGEEIQLAFSSGVYCGIEGAKRRSKTSSLEQIRPCTEPKKREENILLQVNATSLGQDIAG